MNELSAAELSEYDFTLLVDSSGSMGAPGRWEQAKTIAFAIANFSGKIDTNGITVISFGSTVDAYQNTTADKVPEIFAKGPNGTTPLHTALLKADEIRKQSTKKSFTVIVTDGAPDDEASCVTLLTEIANSLNQDNDATFLFIQIGDDAGASKFLSSLDDSIAAKFDVVDRKTVEEFNSLGFEKLFYEAQNG